MDLTIEEMGLLVYELCSDRRSSTQDIVIEIFKSCGIIPKYALVEKLEQLIRPYKFSLTGLSNIVEEIHKIVYTRNELDSLWDKTNI